MYAFADPTVIIYIAVLIVSIYGAGLFAWWWWSIGRASSVFAYVTFIFVGQIAETGVSLWARLLGLTVGVAARLEFQESFFWPMRNIVLLAALTAMVVHMTHRVVKQRWRALNNNSE